MKIFSGGIGTETNTFSPLPTGLANFDVARTADDAHNVLYGSTLDVFRKLTQARGWQFEFGLYAFAQPAGTTTRPAYEALRDELLDKLRAALPVDVVLLCLHGAMVAEGYDDCESDLVRRVRQMVGTAVKIGIELDLHCDIVQQMVDDADAIVLFKEYPHTDVDVRAAELFNITAAAAEGKSKPTMALFDCRMAGLFHTTRQPMRGFVDEMQALEGKEGVLSVSLAHSFEYSDVPSMGAYALSVTENDPAQATRVAKQVGRKFYALRHAVVARHPALNDALDQAMRLMGSGKPVVFADTGDNAGGGAPSDSTFVLRELLRRGVRNASLALLWDPIAVQIAQSAGVGATLPLRLGGKVGAVSGDPLDLTVTVTSAIQQMTQGWPRQNSSPAVMGCGDAVCLRCEGINIIVNATRTQVLGTEVFTNFGIDLAAQDLLVVKSTQHFYAAFAPIAAHVVYAATPGVMSQDLTAIPYRRINTHKFPWVDDAFA